MAGPAIILVEPQIGENIGAAARAMYNFGLRDLRLVAPRDGWPNAAATQNASGAFDHFGATVFDTLQDAIADLHFTLATTARPRDMVKPVFTPQAAIIESHSRAAKDEKTGFIFGRERTGLENDDIALCQAIVTFPTNPDFSSLNLAQAVLLMSYTWFSTQDDTPGRQLDPGDSAPVTQEKLDEFMDRLIKELEAGKFFRSDGLRPTMERNIRNIFTRGGLTDQEVRTLQGMLSALIGNKVS